MIYIDTDVLIHAYVVQDERKHRQSLELIGAAVAEEDAAISTLSIQEVLYVLGRMDLASDEIEVIYNKVLLLQPLDYDVEDLKRAVKIAKRVGFRRINDCIHTAIAESHCTELVTYNRRDFNRIRSFATVDIRIL